MKNSIQFRLIFGVCLAFAIYAAVARASLDDILAPLPVESVAPISKQSLFVQRAQQPAKDELVERQVAAQEQNPNFSAILTADVHEAVTVALEDRLRPNGDITLIPLRDLPDLTKYSHPFNVNLINIPSRLNRGNVLIRFQVENEEGVLGEWSIPFRAHLYTDVWFPRAHLRRGDIASASDFEARQIDMLVEPDAVPAALEYLLRHEYGRDIVPGKALQWNDLVERSLIRKGELVEVVAVNGLLSISMRAVARQDGSNGDLIVLRNLESSKEFSARVVGENRAEVVF
ncbi:flagellar basal body P-ring formation chaperone FlgA [Pelagicoccus sp. SDUM812003]|uniref:flagellar basal body P-ring formation chaperone FlgA n=1 Tax=Pelagicoccus sp. SDUM812003 TaxID=3041267 RepID=UPI00280EF3BB|nr:flagellar basal body P-ring formation chaperone FlgA [Pelagicoccus sp. SDUM812003]MDQ8202556.1 flagellar basal body P-ring formation chaperone FlgA [Pelagicoccus sp. SDUM812003]